MDKLFRLVLVLFSYFALLPERLKGLPVICLLLYSTFFLIKNKKKLKTSQLLLTSTPFVILLMSIALTGSFDIEFKRLETSLSLFLMPLFLIICREKLNEKMLIFVFKHYVISTFILGLLFFLEIFINYDIIFVESANRFRNLSKNIFYIEEHPIYNSIIFSIGILIAFYLKKIKNINKFFFVVLIAINFVSLILLLSKGIIISLFLSFFILFKKYWKFYLLSMFFLVVILTIQIKFSNKRGRIKEVFKPNTYKKFNKTVSTSVRYAVYDCSIKAIIKKPIFGYSFGNELNALQDCYDSKSKYLVEGRYNTHNQFIFYLLISGFFGFSFFIFYLSKLIIAMKRRLIFLTILIFFIFAMLFENILARQSGVILFSFFINLFYFFQPQHETFW